MTDQITLACVLVGGKPLLMPDNETGPCARCGMQVQFRPENAHLRRLCLPCIGDEIEESDPGEKIEVVLTKKALDEAAAAINQKKGH